jgi:hypothetical protein
MTFPTDSRHRVSRPAASRFSPDPVRADAKPVWSLKITGKDFDGRDVCFDGDRVYIIRGFEELLAMDLKTGEAAWQQRIPFYSPRKKTFDHYQDYELQAKDGVLYLDGGKCKTVERTESNPLGMLWRPGTIDASTGDVLQDADWYPAITRLPTQPIEIGDWLIERDKRHRFIRATHRLTGETTDQTPDELSHLDISKDLHSTRDPERMLCEGKFVTDKENDERYFKSFKPDGVQWDWQRVVNSAQRFKGLDLSAFKGGLRYWRGLLTLHADSHAWGDIPFIAIDRDTGEALWYGRGAEKAYRAFDNRALLEPPADSRDLMLLRQHRMYTCEVQEQHRVQERDVWREKGTGDPAMAEFESIKTFDEPDMPERMQKKELVFYEFSHRLPMSGESSVLSAVDPLTGDEVWSTEKTLTSPFEASTGTHMVGAFPLARSGNTLWVRHRVCKEGKRKDDRATYRESAQLVALDYNTGEVLSKQKCAANADFAAIHKGHLILKEGRKLVCYA